MRKNNKGFTLLELLISIAILAIILVPLLNNFVVAAKLNATSKKTHKATTIAQNLIESIKAEEIGELVNTSHGLNPFNLLINEISGMEELTLVGAPYLFQSEPVINLDREKLYFGIYGIKDESQKFDALITLDAVPYDSTVSVEPGTTLYYNQFQMPEIKDINKEENALITQSFEDNWAVDTLYERHVSFCADYNAAALDEEPPRATITPDTIETLKSKITRDIKININANLEDTNSVIVETIYDYKCSTTAINGNSVSYVVYKKTIAKPMDEIYLFYHPLSLNSDKITINNFANIDSKVYVVKQDGFITDAGYRARIINTSTDITLYSNLILSQIDSSILDGVAGAIPVNAGDIITKDASKKRLYKVTVEIFKSEIEEANRYQDRLAIMNATKGE
jgi:prepilin-type N-terminal cleavage/methylation domain-containing protein